MAIDDLALSLAAAVGQTLPAEYLAFLDGLQARPTPDDGDDPVLDFNGRQWLPHNRSRLAETVPHRRRETAFPFAHEMARHAELLRAADAAHDGRRLRSWPSKGLRSTGWPAGSASATTATVSRCLSTRTRAGCLPITTTAWTWSSGPRRWSSW